MQYAIELYYDMEAEEKLYALSKKVADAKLSTKFMEWKTRPKTLYLFFGTLTITFAWRMILSFNLYPLR